MEVAVANAKVIGENEFMMGHFLQETIAMGAQAR